MFCESGESYFRDPDNQVARSGLNKVCKRLKITTNAIIKFNNRYTPAIKKDIKWLEIT